MQFFPGNCTHILTRSQGKKFEYMFLVKIASKGTSLRQSILCSVYLCRFPLSIEAFRDMFQVFWRAFNISSHLIIVSTYVFRAVFIILMAHHFLHTSPYKMSVFERLVTCSFFLGIVLTY